MYADEGADCEAEFNRVCYPLYSATPGWAEESRQFLARMIKSPDVSSHYSHEFPRFDPGALPLRSGAPCWPSPAKTTLWTARRGAAPVSRLRTSKG